MKIPKQAYTAEFKELAVKRVKDSHSVSMVRKELGLGAQTLRNWIKASAEGKLGGASGRVVTPEEMELSRLRAENLRLKHQRAASGKPGSMKSTRWQTKNRVNLIRDQL